MVTETPLPQQEGPQTPISPLTSGQAGSAAQHDIYPRHLPFPPSLLPGHTLFTASRKSFSVTVFRRARMAYIPASVHTLRMSAPVLLGHSRASSSNLQKSSPNQRS